MIKFNSAQEIDLSILEVKDIVDINVLQNFQNNFANGMGLSVVTVNRDGEKIINNYINGDSSVTDSFLIKEILKDVVESKSAYTDKTLDGKNIFATPIIVEDEVLGAIICENADKESVNTDSALSVLEIFISSVISNGYYKKSVENLSSNLAESFIQISSSLEALAESAQSITEQQQSLGTDISKVESVTSEIADVTTSINKLADKTMMLGLNASIEAARLGNEGRGFAVVATQIRELSDSSRQTSGYIKKLNDQINEYVIATIDNSKKSLEITEDQSAAMEELSATIQTMVSLAHKLKAMVSE